MLAGLVTGLFSIPEGMAYASIGGFNPVAGLYSGMIPGIFGSLFSRTVLMVTNPVVVLSMRALPDVLGDDGIVPATDRVFGAVHTAVIRGQSWITAQRGT